MANDRFPFSPVLGVKASAASGDTSVASQGKSFPFAHGTVLCGSRNTKWIYLLNGAATITNSATITFAASFTATPGQTGDWRALQAKSGTGGTTGAGLILPGESFWAFSSTNFAL